MQFTFDGSPQNCKVQIELCVNRSLSWPANFIKPAEFILSAITRERTGEKEFCHFDTKQWNISKCKILNTCKNEGYLELGIPSSVQFTVNGETINTGSEELRYLG